MTLYLTEIPVHFDNIDIFMDAFEELAESMSCFEGDKPEDWKLLIYTQVKPDKNEIKHVLEILSQSENIPLAEYKISKIKETDWVAESQKNFEPVKAGSFFVYPSWREGEVPEGMCGIEIDPQRAFGTGGHETTSGCLILIGKLAEEHQFTNMLDMGCGSGILAIAMAKKWPEAAILAADIDPVCVETAINNAAINDVADNIKIIESNGYDSATVKKRAPYDLIVSNILAQPLIDFAPKAKKSLKKGGHLILAGLMNNQAADVIKAHEEQGLKLLGVNEAGNWSIVHMQG